ncbi:MAG: hypothetical protein LBR70_05135 [Lactobacillaceae bacterium]|jgi:uncharacterized membrane protein YuzA (DUF378 family)|nr:hypothetical protein [Lactobacillaceae bacterium]
MEKLMELYKKYAKYIFAGATAYWLVVGLIGDVLGYLFTIIGLGLVVHILYIAVGLVGVVKLIEIFKPELIEKYVKTKTPKK